MAAQVVDGRQTQLVLQSHKYLLGLLDLVVVGHQVLLVVLLVRDVEHQPHLQARLRALEALPLGLVVVAQRVQTAGLEHVAVLVALLLPRDLVVDLDRLPTLHKYL